MTTTETTYRANLPAVAHESFDDEAVLIHFESGRYYSLNATGKAVWSALVAGSTLSAMASHLETRYAAGAPALRAAVAEFVATLEQQGLVVAAAPTAVTSPPATAAGAAPAGDREPFVEPRLDVFTDMQDLLLLDPIHDVDEGGWPHVRK